MGILHDAKREYLLFFVFEQLQCAYAVFSGSLEESVNLTEQAARHRRRAVVDIERVLVADVFLLSGRDTVQSAVVKARRDIAIGRQQTAHYHANRCIH